MGGTRVGVVLPDDRGGLAPSGAAFATYFASMTTSGSQSIDVSAGGDGVAISADAVTVTTNCRAGYNLSVATSVNDNNLYYDGSVSNNANGTYFEPVDGINTLANNTNKWGYYYNSSNANAPTKTNVFSAVPASSGTPAALVTPTASETDISDSYNVYFGVSINSNLKAGTYKMIQDADSNNSNGSITYYLTMATSCMPYTVVFNPTSTASGSSVSGTGTMSSQTIPVGDATALNANTFVAPSGYEFDSWNTAQDGSGTTYADQASVTDLAAGGGSITLYAQWEAVATRMDCSNPNSYLYCKVADQVKTNSTACAVTVKDANGQDKCSQNATALQATISAPAAGSTPATDTSNSGVFLYNSTAFNGSSDVDDGYNIYYFRGILDSNLNNTTSTYGSNGDSAYYQNYVKLGDTCWRIVRTTASGGTKMIYNGLYSGGTTANSCANAQANAQVTTSAFNGDSTTYQQIVRVGYTYNNTYAVNTASTKTIAEVLGSNSDDLSKPVNNTDSDIKYYIEHDWFTGAIGSYESILEPNAGYCNDRTVYDDTSPYTQQNELTVDVTTYGTSGLPKLNFGSYVRNKIANGTRTLTLTCPRNIVDLYSTSTDSGGNGQLNKPVALLTADEAALAGSGGNGRTSVATNSSNYSYSSYLRSGNYFWLLSPAARYSSGLARGFYLVSNGNLNSNSVDYTRGVRLAISLKPGTTAASGTGTATDPWVVNAP